MAGTVAMAHAAGDHVCDCLEAAMRMVWEATDIVLRVVGAERVEHEKRIEPARSGWVSTRVSFTPAPSDVGWPTINRSTERGRVTVSALGFVRVVVVITFPIE